MTVLDMNAMGKAVDAALATDTAPPGPVDMEALHQGMTRKAPHLFTVTTPYHPTKPIQVWDCGDTLTELRRSLPRVLPTRSAPDGVEATWSDFFAGAGGSSSGIGEVPGAGVRMAVNHWPLAIETHNFNHPDTDHDVANVARTDPKRYPRTDFAWFSPECTYWSVARGEACDYDLQSEQLALDVMEGDPETPEAREARWRSRMLMTDVVRFARHHQYKGIIVENVPDILKWAALPRMLREMEAEGYRWKIITLNSAFAQATGMPAPQLRDRVYIIFWKAIYKTPDWNKWLRPKSSCPSCGDVVDGIYNPKPGKLRPMRYGPRAQYTYRCPAKACAGQMVHPLVLPAASAIDWSLPAERIGDRKRPLAAKTRARIAAGLERYCQPVVVETSGHTFERRPGVRSWPVDRPLGTQHTTLSKSIAVGPEMLVPTGGTWNDDASTVEGPMRTCTTRENTALVVPLEGRDGVFARPANDPMRAQTTRHQDALVVPLRNNGVATPPTHPFKTVAAGGEHHALVMRNNHGGAEMCTPAGEPIRTLTTAGHQSLIGLPADAAMVMRNNTARGDQGQMSYRPNEPLRTFTTEGGQSLIRWDHVLYAYDTGIMRPLDEPIPAQTTVDGDALVGTAVDVDDCTLRMLAVAEIQAGMDFSSGYVLLGKAKRDKVRMLGNAVTRCSARDLVACLMEGVTGVEIPKFELV